MKTVTIKDFKFDPSLVSIAVGDIVEWINKDYTEHTVTSAGNFDSGSLEQDQKFSHVFTVSCRYDYYCSFHPHMKGQIIVYN